MMTSGIEANEVIGRKAYKMKKEHSLIAVVPKLCSKHSFFLKPLQEFGLRAKFDSRAF